jgi:hypothetical protein
VLHRSSDAAAEEYQIADVGSTRLVVRRGEVDAVQRALASGTLYEYAARHPDARALAGRGIAYAVPLPNGTRIVVRHNRHGGLLAPLTRDLFLPPTRAPYELAIAQRLTASGVPTPEIIAYAVYSVGPLLRRSDVASREIEHSADLALILTQSVKTERITALDATARLIGLLSACGARHHDLNVKNVLLARSSTGFTAHVLDVDRVELGRPGDSRITERNLDRFMRSARKWRALYGARVEEAELAAVAASVRRFVGARSSGALRPSARS